MLFKGGFDEFQGGGLPGYGGGGGLYLGRAVAVLLGEFEAAMLLDLGTTGSSDKSDIVEAESSIYQAFPPDPSSAEKSPVSSSSIAYPGREGARTISTVVRFSMTSRWPPFWLKWRPEERGEFPAELKLLKLPRDLDPNNFCALSLKFCA